MTIFGKLTQKRSSGMSRFDINGNLLREHTYMYAISFEIAAFLLSLFCFLYCLIAKRKQYIPPKGVSNR